MDKAGWSPALATSRCAAQRLSGPEILRVVNGRTHRLPRFRDAADGVQGGHHKERASVRESRPEHKDSHMKKRGHRRPPKVRLLENGLLCKPNRPIAWRNFSDRRRLTARTCRRSSADGLRLRRTTPPSAPSLLQVRRWRLAGLDTRLPLRRSSVRLRSDTDALFQEVRKPPMRGR
jgi:hypothetical protein